MTTPDSQLLGYARVSTTDQSPDLQVDALKAAGCGRVWVEYASGAKDKRPELAKVLDHLRPGDTLVVWKLDRLGRKVVQLLAMVNALAERGVEFRSITEGMDTRTATGRAFFTMCALFAQLERDLLIERTEAGVAAARARGHVGGRKAVLSGAQVVAARSMYAERSMTVQQIADELGVSRRTVYRVVRDTIPV